MAGNDASRDDLLPGGFSDDATVPPGWDAALEIERGLEQREFTPAFQPIVDMTNGSVVGFEALARWRHPHRGMLPPKDFVGNAEACGLIASIDAQILDQAWNAFGAMLASGAAGEVKTLSVNLSAHNLLDRAIVDRLERLLSSRPAVPGLLQLEITETLLINNHERAYAILNALKELGISIALDDFGTGYSSLVYLQKLPIDCIKIDRSFSAEILSCARSRTIVGAITGLADSLGISTVAEGVEEEAVAQALLSVGCRFGQGHHFGAPVAPAAMNRP